MPPDLRSNNGAESYLNKLNQALLAAVEQSGDLFLSNAVLDGRFALRACIVNFRTTQADVEAVPELVAAMGRRIDGELRPRGFIRRGD